MENGGGVGVAAERVIEAAAVGGDLCAEAVSLRGGGGLGLVEQRGDFRIAALIEKVEGEVVEGGGEFRAGRSFLAAGEHFAKQVFRIHELPEVLQGEGFRLAGIGQHFRRVGGQQIAGGGEMGECFVRLSGLALDHAERLLADGEFPCAGGIGLLFPLRLPFCDQRFQLRFCGVELREVECEARRPCQGGGRCEKAGEVQRETHAGSGWEKLCRPEM